MKVEEDKPQDERGLYLHPEVYGQPQEKGIVYARRPPEMEGMKARLGVEVSKAVISD